MLAEFRHITKDYPVGWLGRSVLRAVDDVSFSLQPGEALALLGPNRAGKTTLVKMLLGLCAPTQGLALRFNQPAHVRTTLTRVGYVHENPAFPRYWHARGLLHYYGALTLLDEPTVQKRTETLLERFGLSDRATEPISRFSKGMIQRLGFAQALLNEPDLLVLDEPAEGLDLLGRALIRDIVVEWKARGKAVLLVSHVLHEVAELCERVAVLVKGRLSFIGTMKELTRASGSVEPLSLEKSLQLLYV